MALRNKKVDTGVGNTLGESPVLMPDIRHKSPEHIDNSQLLQAVHIHLRQMIRPKEILHVNQHWC